MTPRELKIPDDFEAGQVLNIDKPAGCTSFDVVRKIRRWTRCKKVGHAGTLDPQATGVLIVCTGKATKQVNQFMGQEKIYEAVIELGKVTDSDDLEGKVLEENPVPSIRLETIQACLDEFIGTIEQIPPMFSAIKIDGKRLYKLARQGKTVERPPRQVVIHEIKLNAWETPDLSIQVRCSKGTYIRSLARDIGEKLGPGACLKSLRRTRIGDFSVDDAWTLPRFEAMLNHEHEHLSIH